MGFTVARKPNAPLMPLSGKTRDDTISAVRKTKAVAAVKSMQQKSLNLGNDKMSLKEINAIIDTARGKTGG
ncbi:MAG: hypothetical protein LBR23_02020 [Spirochaetaceae bacterium]|jgi:hypothetical protein|nr:hypothetical protein [Spirochaetaceae bacterium]